MSNDHNQPPTDKQIIAAFQDFASQRAGAGVMLAQSVVDVRFANGTVTVALDPSRSGAQYWALLETSPYDNHAELFGIPAAFDDEDGVWLRQRVGLVEVLDIAGRPLGTLTTAELNRKATGR